VKPEFQVATRIVAVLPVLLLFAACGSEGESNSDIPEHEAVFEAILESTSPEQRALLEDGAVTRTEYESAVLNTARCMDDEGYATAVEELGILLRVVSSDGVASLEEVQRWRDAYTECAGIYLRDVESVWQLQHIPTEQEQEENRRAMLECVRGYGIEVEDHSVLEALRIEGELSERDDVAVRLCSARHMSSGMADTSMLEDRLDRLSE
jgi:hypothetical protein